MTFTSHEWRVKSSNSVLLGALTHNLWRILDGVRTGLMPGSSTAHQEPAESFVGPPAEPESAGALVDLAENVMASLSITRVTEILPCRRGDVCPRA